MKKFVSDESRGHGLRHLAPTLERGSEEERPAQDAQLPKATDWMDSNACEIHLTPESANGGVEMQGMLAIYRRTSPILF